MSVVERYLAAWPQAFANTVSLTVLGFAIGFVLAVPIAGTRLSRNRAVASLVAGYVYIVRGTPLLVQLFIIYYGIGQFSRELRDVGLWWLFKDAFNCALLAFALNSAAYQSEILRGGIAAVPGGQIEAGAALGLSRRKVFRLVVLPIALVRGLPALGNELVLLLKASALASIITVRDITGQVRVLYSQTFELSVFYLAALNYLAVVILIQVAWAGLENRYPWARHGGAR